MKTITVNIATYPRRFNSLLKTIDSLKNQGVDVLRVCMNEFDHIPDEIYNHLDGFHSVVIEIPDKDLKDNGKFLWICAGEYAFTCDDDLIYPPKYISDMVEHLKKYPIVTHHGRLLNGLGRNYYRDHKRFHCLGVVNYEGRIDVAGTGVCAFDSDAIDTSSIPFDPRQCMSDILFSECAAKQKVQITIVPHQMGYFGYTTPDEGDTIFDKHHHDCRVQSLIADEIFKMNH